MEDKTIKEMRGLLNNYPVQIEFSDSKDYLNIAKNITLICDVLFFCYHKSTKEDIKKDIESEIEFIKKGFIEISNEYVKYVSKKSNFGKSQIYNKIKSLIDEDLVTILDKIQIYLSALPIKMKKEIYTPRTHGIAGAYAEDYETGEISKGEKVQDGQTFKVEEGEVIPA